MPTYPLVIRSRVLLPRQRLQIRLHDTRAAAALEGHDTFAAVFSPRPGQVSSVGVAARITARQAAPHARVDLEVVGDVRLRLANECAVSGDEVAVEHLAEIPGDDDLDRLRAELQEGWQRFAAVAAESGEGAAIHARLHADPTIASYQAATLLPLSHVERQELLEIGTTSERLDRLLRIVAGETGILRHLLGMGRMGA